MFDMTFPLGAPLREARAKGRIYKMHLKMAPAPLPFKEAIDLLTKTTKNYPPPKINLQRPEHLKMSISKNHCP
jgi:hypothetical protein